MAERLEEISGMDTEKILEEINKLSPHDAYIRGRCDMWDAMNNEDIKEMLKTSEQILRNLEKAKTACKRGEWIPVSERLPKGSDIVLLSLPPHIDPDGEECSASVICGHYIGGRNAGWGLSDGDTFGYGLVSVKKGTNPVAWMPLPEPYNPEQTLKYADNPTTESALAPAT